MVVLPRTNEEPDDASRERASAGVRTVLVVDDHRTFADLLVLALAGQPSLRCLGVAYTIESGLDRCAALQPDVVVLDYHFAGSDRTGIDAAGAIIDRHPATTVILLTGNADPRMLREAARVGVSSLLPKDGALVDLLAALETPPANGLVVHPALLRSLVVGRAPEDRMPHLSAREAETLDLLTMGLDVRAIADHMGVSVNTCRAYVKSVLAKLHAHSQLEAVAIARRFGRTAEDGRL